MEHNFINNYLSRLTDKDRIKKEIIIDDTQISSVVRNIK